MRTLPDVTKRLQHIPTVYKHDIDDDGKALDASAADVKQLMHECYEFLKPPREVYHPDRPGPTKPSVDGNNYTVEEIERNQRELELR